MIPVLWHIADSFWDSTFPRWVLDHAGECKHVTPLVLEAVEGGWKFHSGPVGVIVIPGQHSCNDYNHLNEYASHFEKVLWIITGDEEGIFHSDRLQHPNQRKWWFTPPFNPKQQVDVVAPFGWTTEARRLIADARHKHRGEPRKFDWSFYGQMTHSRRVQCVDATQGIPNGDLLLTEGFSQGVPQEQYFDAMVQSKIVLCPAGPCTPDSFRFAEALEAGCVPIVDGLTQNEAYPAGYWSYVVGPSRPFPVIHDWKRLPSMIEDVLKSWPFTSVACEMWWREYKNSLVEKMRKELQP